MSAGGTGISVVTPTLGRPDEVRGMLANLALQTAVPDEVVLIDGAPKDRRTEDAVAALVASETLPFDVHWARYGGGTAIQRNRGIDRARGRFIAFIDDDIRLEPDFFALLLAAYDDPERRDVGAIVGCISNQVLDIATSPRWRWYRRLRLFGTYRPGAFDRRTGHPINRYLQPPHETLRPVDFMGSNCALWRAEVFADGLRFDPFFRDFGVLEDAHLALSAGRRWRLLEHGAARCVHLDAPGGRTAPWRVAYKTAVNYRYVFLDIVRPRAVAQERGWWTVQLVDFLRLAAYALRRPSRRAWSVTVGKLLGLVAAARLATPSAMRPCVDGSAPAASSVAPPVDPAPGDVSSIAADATAPPSPAAVPAPSPASSP
ncbi:MAG: glycosyltransferase, partial [Acidobacteriota bacterium]